MHITVHLGKVYIYYYLYERCTVVIHFNDICITPEHEVPIHVVFTLFIMLDIVRML